MYCTKTLFNRQAYGTELKPEIELNLELRRLNKSELNFYMKKTRNLV